MLCGCQGDSWPMRWEGTSTMRGCYALCLANLSASSFPTMCVWALILQMVILWWDFFSVFIVQLIKSIFGWLYWEDGFLMWLRRIHMLFTLFVNTNVSVGSSLVCSMAIKSVYDHTMRILGYMGT